MSMEQRIESLERSLARTRRLNLGLLLGLSALVVGGARSEPEVLTARELVIVDGEGRRRVMLTGDDQGMAGLRIFDEDGVSRISSGVAANNASYTQWFDSQGRSRLAALCSQTGESSFQWRDADNRLRIGAATLNNGESSMMWIAPNGSRQIRMLTDANGLAKFVCGDRTWPE